MLGPPKTRELNRSVPISLERLVPADHFYRHLDAGLDLSFVRDWVADRYATRHRAVFHRRLLVEKRAVVGCLTWLSAGHNLKRKGWMMDARIDVITLAVADLERALTFYRDGLGLQTQGVIGTEWVGDDRTPAGATATFELHGGLLLALYPRTELAKDANLALAPPTPGEFSIGQLVASKADVDALLSRAQAAGATLTNPPHDRPWGIYSGYFRDPDGHLWEVIWNPHMPPRA